MRRKQGSEMDMIRKLGEKGGEPNPKYVIDQSRSTGLGAFEWGLGTSHGGQCKENQKRKKREVIGGARSGRSQTSLVYFTVSARNNSEANDGH